MNKAIALIISLVLGWGIAGGLTTAFLFDIDKAGAQGAQGVRGTQGHIGIQGPRGLPGPKGPQGETGEAGRRAPIIQYVNPPYYSSLGGWCISVTDGYANMRTGPGINNDVVVRIPNHSCGITFLGGFQQGPSARDGDVSWSYNSWNGYSGWVIDSFLVLG